MRIGALSRLGLYGVFALALAGTYLLLGTGKVHIAIENSGVAVDGAIIDVRAGYVRAGRRHTLQLYEGEARSKTPITVQVPFSLPWSFESLTVYIRHPFYRETSQYSMGNPHWRSQTISVRPEYWSKSRENYRVPPSEMTTIAALEHLHWLRTHYLESVPNVTAAREVLRAQLMLGSLAMAGGKREPGWEETRLQAMNEYRMLFETVDELTYQPCPAEETSPVDVVACGRTRGSVIWPQ